MQQNQGHCDSGSQEGGHGGPQGIVARTPGKAISDHGGGTAPAFPKPKGKARPAEDDTAKRRPIMRSRAQGLERSAALTWRPGGKICTEGQKPTIHDSRLASASALWPVDRRGSRQLRSQPCTVCAPRGSRQPGPVSTRQDRSQGLCSRRHADFAGWMLSCRCRSVTPVAPVPGSLAWCPAPHSRARPGRRLRSPVHLAHCQQLPSPRSWLNASRQRVVGLIASPPSASRQGMARGHSLLPPHPCPVRHRMA